MCHSCPSLTVTDSTRSNRLVPSDPERSHTSRAIPSRPEPSRAVPSRPDMRPERSQAVPSLVEQIGAARRGARVLTSVEKKKTDRPAKLVGIKSDLRGLWSRGQLARRLCPSLPRDQRGRVRHAHPRSSQSGHAARKSCSLLTTTTLLRRGLLRLVCCGAFLQGRRQVLPLRRLAAVSSVQCCHAETTDGRLTVDAAAVASVRCDDEIAGDTDTRGIPPWKIPVFSAPLSESTSEIRNDKETAFI